MSSSSSYLAKSLSQKTLGIGLVSALVLSGMGLFFADQVKAGDMSSNSYELQLGNFNMTSGEKSSSGYTVTDTVGQTAAGEFNSSGYTVFAGFQYLYALSEFSFKITDLNMTLGELQPGVFSTESNQLIISTRTGGYTMYAAATRPFEVKENPSYFISFTNCDTGCTLSSAAAWTNPVNVGFGFNVSGTNASADFVNTTYFRPFADLSSSQSPQVIASVGSKVTDDTLDVTYKAAIDSSQASGNYETAIEFMAVPSY